MSFDAIVAANDNMALGAMHALRERGVRVPEDVSVAGFDDIEETRAITPSLTTVRAPWYSLGSKSVDLVLSKLAKESRARSKSPGDRAGLSRVLRLPA